MAGKIKRMIDKIISEKAKGNAIIASSVRTKMILKGISVDKFADSSPDDPEIIKTLGIIAKEFGITL